MNPASGGIPAIDRIVMTKENVRNVKFPRFFRSSNDLKNLKSKINKTKAIIVTNNKYIEILNIKIPKVYSMYKFPNVLLVKNIHE